MPGDFSTQLGASFAMIDPSKPIPTKKFAQAMDTILPIFQHTGSVFLFAKMDTEEKRDDLLGCSGLFPTLTELVDADEKAGTVLEPESHARNLDRLKNMVAFIRHLVNRLLLDRNVTLKEAVTNAYDTVLARTHPWAIRATVSMGVLLLPSKESFLEKLGEKSIDDAREGLQRFVQAAGPIIQAIEGLYSEPINDTI